MAINLKYISIFPAIFSLLLTFTVGSSPENEADFETVLSQNLESSQVLTVQNNSLFAVSSPFNPEPEAVKQIKVVITAYSSTPWETDDSPYLTAAGTWVRDGIIANNYLPFGSKVRIPELYGDRIFVVEDRMNSRIGYYHVDIWFPSYQEALNFGSKRTYIEVLEN
jgi:3D (Asp-Asp-Asp) domain-containing protein